MKKYIHVLQLRCLIPKSGHVVGTEWLTLNPPTIKILKSESYSLVKSSRSSSSSSSGSGSGSKCEVTIL
jgi:hypothetical protein